MDKPRVVLHWKRTHRPRGRSRAGLLSPEEQACARVALSVHRVRFGSYTKVAKAMRVHEKSVVRAASPKARLVVGMALEIARVAGVPIDDVLSGRFPAPGACPMCGRAQKD